MADILYDGTNAATIMALSPAFMQSDYGLYMSTPRGGVTINVGQYVHPEPDGVTYTVRDTTDGPDPDFPP
jgi:hypothetical protein